ncbi:MAG: hypothetical protein WDN30_14395 [Pararobbsia sp.]
MQKASYKGLIHKSYEGELVLDGLRGNTSDGSFTNVWEFSATDPAIVEQLGQAANSGKHVRLHYRQSYVHSPFARDTDYVVTRVDGL